jgi:hypothetical protein
VARKEEGKEKAKKLGFIGKLKSKSLGSSGRRMAPFLGFSGTMKGKRLKQKRKYFNNTYNEGE